MNLVTILKNLFMVMMMMMIMTMMRKVRMTK